MNRIIALFAFLCLIGTRVDAQQINLVSDGSDQITVDVVQEGIKDKKALESARWILYNAIFFRGIPGSSVCREPLVGTDESFVDQHKDYFDELVKKERFNSFLSSQRLVDYQKKKKISTCRFVVNVRALRKDLEQQGVKRRFGF